MEHGIYQFTDCFWHRHDCANTAVQVFHLVRKVPMSQLLADIGWRLSGKVSGNTRSTPDLTSRHFGEVFFQSTYHRPPTDLERTSQRIRSGEFYGLIKCEICILPALENKFADMGLIFRNLPFGGD